MNEYRFVVGGEVIVLKLEIASFKVNALSQYVKFLTNASMYSSPLRGIAYPI